MSESSCENSFYDSCEEFDEEFDEDVFFEQGCSDKHRPDYLTTDVMDMASYDVYVKHTLKPDKFTINIPFNRIHHHLASVIQAVPDSFDSSEYQYTLTISILFPFGYRISNIDIKIELANFNNIHFQLSQLVRQTIIEAQTDNYTKNLIELIYKKLVLFIPNVNRYCIGCTQPFGYEPPIPAFCNRALCLYQMINLGLTDLYNELLHYSMESDLKISFCHSALDSPRRHIIFGDIPSELEESNSAIAYDNMKQLLNLIPSVHEMLQMTSSNQELRKLLNSIDNKLYYFLTWIILSCQNYIKDVTSDILQGDDSQFPKELLTTKEYSHQEVSFTNNIKRVFKIISDSPQRENEFQKKEISKDYQVELAFHGTSIENLHNILHNSLENCSGTDKQVTGAAYGSGVYLGKNLQTSLSYTRQGKTWEKSQLTDNKTYSCCIVVKFAKPRDASLYRDVGFYVVPDSTLLQNRYLLII